jgi:hypothetical protein
LKARKIIGILFCSALAILCSCKRADEKITTSQDARLEFSKETLLFDTIFSTVGSSTQAFYVFNRNKNAVKISSIQVGGLATSNYTITIDGDQTYFKSDVELKGKDSILVLVKVLINPQSQNLPYLVADSIIFNTNGNIQQVKLLAYGQDANFLNNVTLPCNTTWNSAKPYVIYNSVIVPPGCSLTIDKGVKVYSHKNSFIKVQGTLLVQGQADSLVRFEGDNLDNKYSNLAAQWGGIIFESGSKNNAIDWAYIKNAETGISMKQESDADTIAELVISNSILRNMSEKGIDALATDLYAWNCLISNCAGNLFSGTGGGNYFFRHCTLAGYSYTFFRSSPAMQLSNFSSSVSGMLYSRMINTVIYGDLGADELGLGDNGSSGFDVMADNCLIKRSVALSGSNNLNVNPEFQNPAQGDFHPDSTSGSPLIDAGKLTGILNDLDNQVRDAVPDIGAFEE